MTEQNISEDVREIVEKMRYHANHDNVRGSEEEYIRYFADMLEALLPPPPTLADMLWSERDKCAGMQADLAQGDRVVLLNGYPDCNGMVQVMDKGLEVCREHPKNITPRPDLPSMEWPGTDQDGEDVTKVDYVSVAGGRTAYGPWTVARLRKKPDPAPALPEGWRLADHPDRGRVIVTTTPDRYGSVYYVLPADADYMGYGWHACDPDELTYLDQEADTADTVPESTLAVGSVWGDADALTAACRESGRDQIIVADKDGDAYVWSEAAEWWESVSPKSVNGPHTILHAGKKADQ